MTRRRGVVVTVTYLTHSAYFAGLAQHQLVEAAQSAGSVSQWNYSRKALGVPVARAGDVEAQLVVQGFEVQVELPGVASR